MTVDLPTLIVPQKLAWEQGEGERVARIYPGPPNTTIDRSAIGDNDAQDVKNSTTVNGVWELDQRYRQFAPCPVTASDVTCAFSSPTSITLSYSGGCADETQNWGAGTLTAVCATHP